MPSWPMKIMTAEAQRLLALATEDAELRAELRDLAHEILAATGTSQNSTAAAAPAPADRDAPSTLAEGDENADATTHAPPPDVQAEASEPLRELTLGRSRPLRAEAPRPHDAVAIDTDLAEPEARCRLRAEGARWAALRQRQMKQGNDAQVESDPDDRETATWAERLTDGFYWVNASGSARRIDLSSFDEAAGCFDALAEALALVRSLSDHQRGGNANALAQALPLLAEAQSALRSVLERFQIADEPDQVQVFEWLKATAARHHVYIKRFMRADDPADPALWPDLLARIRRIEARRAPAGRRSGDEPLFDRLRAPLTAIRAGSATDGDWQVIIKTVDELVGQGVAPSNREVRELLLPVIDDLPERDDLPHGFRLVLAEIDRFLATHAAPTQAPVAHALSPETLEAARLLNGKSVVMIGGTRRREAQEALKRALGLADLIWIETKEHQAVRTFEPSIARADVALVLLAIRWSSHAFGEVKHLCDRLGKPLVRLPGGYSPNQVAAQILSQCSGQLGTE